MRRSNKLQKLRIADENWSQLPKRIQSAIRRGDPGAGAVAQDYLEEVGKNRRRCSNWQKESNNSGVRVCGKGLTSWRRGILAPGIVAGFTCRWQRDQNTNCFWAVERVYGPEKDYKSKHIQTGYAKSSSAAKIAVNKVLRKLGYK